MLNRRHFLTAAGTLTLLPLVPAGIRNVVANPAIVNDGKFLVLIRAIGGMDVTLGLDPWTDAANLPLKTDMFVEYNPADLKAVNATMKIGPSAEGLLTHAGDFSIINGVFMSSVDNGHDASLTYISAGSATNTAPTLPVEVARSTVEGDFGVLFNLNLSMGDRVVPASSLSELLELPSRTDLTSILQGLTSGGGSGHYFDAVRRVIASNGSTKQFIQHLLSFGPVESLNNNHVLAASFMANVSSCAQLDLTSINLDTHANHAGTHLAQQKIVWEQVGVLFKLFKQTPYGSNGESLFDRTTFMVVSDFARTPALNAAGGKDHNPMTNSVLLAGRGVKGGLVVGASKLVKAAESPTGASYHIGYPIDYATGEVQFSRTPQSEMIFPENVAETVAAIMDVDRAIFRSLPVGTKTLNALIKT